jgi:hypothetical protein
MKCLHTVPYGKIRDSCIIPNSPFSDDQNVPTSSCTFSLVYLRQFGTAKFLFGTHSSYVYLFPPFTPSLNFFGSIWYIVISLKDVHTHYHHQRQFNNTFIKTQKVPGHRLCKSALFSEAESTSTQNTFFFLSLTSRRKMKAKQLQNVVSGLNIVANTLSEQPKWTLDGRKLLMIERNLWIYLVEISKSQ